MTRDSEAALLVCGALLALSAPAAVRPQGACTYAPSGHLTGLPYQLPVTYLTPGVADWMVAAPLPAECADAGGQAVGQEAIACDHDARPGVRAERGGLHVRRAGWLRGYATVQLTVYCSLAYPPQLDPAQLNMLPARPNVLPAQPNMLPARPNVLPARPNMLPARPNVLPAHPNMLPARPKVLPALPNRSQTVIAPALPATSPTQQQLNDTVSSIATTSSPELSSSSNEEDEEDDSEPKSEHIRRQLQWKVVQI